MDGKVVTELLEPVIGKVGQVRLVFQGVSARWAHPSVIVMRWFAKAG